MARRLRELEFGEWRRKFNERDEDKSGKLDLSEVQNVISDIGYTLTVEEIQDVCREVEEDCSRGGKGGIQDGELDFDEFVHLMQIFKTRDGFSAQEQEDLKRTFTKFDRDRSGEVETLELGDLLRWHGHALSLDEVQHLLDQVDSNNNGSLDWREFLRFMRLHREMELQAWRESFEQRDDENMGKISVEAFQEMFAEVSTTKRNNKLSPNGGFLQTPTASEAVTAKKAEIAGQGVQPSPDGTECAEDMVDFEDCLKKVEAEREKRAIEFRKHAGFCKADIERYQEMFDSYDKDKIGTVEASQMGFLLTALGFSLKTSEERDRVQEQIQQAKANALEAGITEVGRQGNVSFWVVMQLLRLLRNKSDQGKLDRETKALQDTKFLGAEARDFRDIFIGIVEDEAKDYPNGEEPKGVTKIGVRKLLLSLDLQITRAKSEVLGEKIQDLSTEGLLDFADFLRLMRWMLTTNFADINSKV
jgi:calmodulin